MTMRVGGTVPLTVTQQLQEVDPPLFGRSMRGQNGTPVVFLHGYGGSPGESVGPPLAAAFRRAGVAVDITAPWVEPKKQVGDRLVSLAPTTLTFELAQIQKLADQTPGKLTLIGHSFGGLGARIYATLHPEKVDRVVLMSPGEGVAHRTARDFGLDENVSPAELQAQFREVIRDGEQQLAQARAAGDGKAVGDLSEQLNWLKMCADIVGYDDTAPIRNLKVPTLLIRAGGDQNLSANMVMSVAREAKGAQVTTVVVPGAGHSLEADTEEQTDANFDLVAKAIAKFLDEGKRGPADVFTAQAGAAAAPNGGPPEARVPQAPDEKLFS